MKRGVANTKAEVTSPLSKKCSSDSMKDADVYTWSEEASSRVYSPSKRPTKEKGLEKADSRKTVSIDVSDKNKRKRARNLSCNELLSMVTDQQADDSSVDFPFDEEREEPVSGTKHGQHGDKASVQLGTPRKGNTKDRKISLRPQRENSGGTFSSVVASSPRGKVKEDSGKGKETTTPSRVRGRPPWREDSGREEVIFSAVVATPPRGKVKQHKEDSGKGKEAATPPGVRGRPPCREESGREEVIFSAVVATPPRGKVKPHKQDPVQNKESSCAVTTSLRVSRRLRKEGQNRKDDASSAVVATPPRGRLRPQRGDSREENTSAAVIATPQSERGKVDCMMEEDLSIASPQRGRGRPRKVASKKVVATPPRGRGRPKKKRIEDVSVAVVVTPLRAKGGPHKENSEKDMESVSPAIAAISPRRRGQPRKRKELDDSSALFATPAAKGGDTSAHSTIGRGPQERPYRMSTAEVGECLHNLSDSEEASSEEELDSTITPPQLSDESSDEATPSSRIGIPLTMKLRRKGSILPEEMYSTPVKQGRSAKMDKECSQKLFTPSPKKRGRPPVNATSPTKRRKKRKRASESVESSSDSEDSPQKGKRRKVDTSFTIPDKEMISEKGRGKMLALGAVKERHVYIYVN